MNIYKDKNNNEVRVVRSNCSSTDGTKSFVVYECSDGKHFCEEMEKFHKNYDFLKKENIVKRDLSNEIEQLAKHLVSLSKKVKEKEIILLSKQIKEVENDPD
jgi:hypothetical protein